MQKNGILDERPSESFIVVQAHSISSETFAARDVSHWDKPLFLVSPEKNMSHFKGSRRAD